MGSRPGMRNVQSADQDMRSSRQRQWKEREIRHSTVGGELGISLDGPEEKDFERTVVGTRNQDQGCYGDSPDGRRS